MKISDDAMKWVKTVVVGGLGGGIAATVAMVSDPTKYTFPRDLGSGKAWPFFFSGAAMTIGAMFLKSPFGQKAVGSFKESQAQLAESKQAIEQAKSDLKSSVAQAQEKPASKPKS